MSVTTATMKLGKRPRRHDVRTLQMARYLTAAVQAQPLQPPASVDYTHGITDWGLMLNDQLGCCTIAAIGHAVQAWTASALGRELTVPDSTILKYYEKWDGYDPANPASDQGGVELDVLNEWRQQGFDGVSLDAYVEIGLSGVRCPMSDVALAIWLFGGAYIGVELPIRAQDQDVWDLSAQLGPDDEPGSWGGHAVYLVGYDTRDSGLGTRELGNSGTRGSGLDIRDSGNGTRNTETESGNSGFRIPNSGDPQLPVPSTQPPTLTCITWGKPKKMTFSWFEKYCSEAYALVSKDWLNTSGISPSGFDLAALEQDLAAVTAEGKSN
jgi:hypothetical protein